MEIIDLKKDKDVSDEYIKTEFAPKKRFKLKEIQTYIPKKKELTGEHKFLSDYCNNQGQINKAKIRLSQLGIMYRFNNYSLNPIVFYGIEIGASIILSVIIVMLSKLGIVFIPIFILGFLGLFTIMIHSADSSDNNSMQMDICTIYTVLNADISNGVYLNNCLKHMTDIVNSKRLKYALEELILNIKDTGTTVDEALILFTDRFTSKDIQKLSGYIKQLVTMGINDDIRNKINRETIQIISDMNNENNGADTAINKLVSGLFVFVLFIAFGYYIYVNIKAGIMII